MASAAGGGGRFLKEDPVTGAWVEIGDERAVKKTGQALRESAPELRAEKQARLMLAAATAAAKASPPSGGAGADYDDDDGGGGGDDFEAGCHDLGADFGGAAAMGGGGGGGTGDDPGLIGEWRG